MALFQNQAVPNFPLSPIAYSSQYQDQLNNILRLFFNNLNAVQQLNVAGLNIDVASLPTEANVASLRVGDVYRDTSTNVLKIKV